MKIIPGKQIKAYKEALEFAFYEAGVSGMKPSVADLFSSMIDTSKLQPEVEKKISAVISTIVLYIGIPSHPWYFGSRLQAN